MSEKQGCPTYAELELALSLAQGEIEAAWQMIESEYDVEPRSELEAQAKTNGFKYGLAQAVHHIWKRDPRTEDVDADQILALAGAHWVSEETKRVIRELRDELKACREVAP